MRWHYFNGGKLNTICDHMVTLAWQASSASQLIWGINKKLKPKQVARSFSNSLRLLLFRLLLFNVHFLDSFTSSLSLTHTLSQDQAYLSTKIIICTPPPQSRRKVASVDITKKYAGVAFFFPVLILSPPTLKPQPFCLCETMNAGDRDRDRDRWELDWDWDWESEGETEKVEKSEIL